MNKYLILARGLPGSGKSTLATLISPANVANDDYIDKYATDRGLTYRDVWSPTLVKEAYRWCKDQVIEYMEGEISPIVVHNTFINEKSVAPYRELAKKYGYRIIITHVEHDHSNRTTHDVPEFAMKQMIANWQIFDRNLKDELCRKEVFMKSETHLNEKNSFMPFTWVSTQIKNSFYKLQNQVIKMIPLINSLF